MSTVIDEPKKIVRFPVCRDKGSVPPLPAESIDEAIEVVNSLWSDADVMRVFGISYATCIVWRRDKGLPFKVIQGDQRPSIRFVPSEVIRWGKRYGKVMNLSNK